MIHNFTRTIATLCLLLLIGHQAAGQVEFVPRDLPRLYHELIWSVSAQNWIAEARYICDYDVNGRLIRKQQDVEFSPGVWVNSLLTEIQYTTQPDSTITSNYYWNGFAWDRSSRKIVVKDSLGRATHDLNYQGSSAWVLESGSRFTFFNDLNGKLEEVLIEDYDMQSTTWDTLQATLLVYGTSSTPDTIIYSEYYNGGWYTSLRDVDIQWQNFNRLKARSFVRQTYFFSQWINNHRFDCAYGPYEYRRCTTEIWDNNAWVPQMRDKHLQDTYGHFTDTGKETYDGSDWVIDTWRHYDHTYSNDKLSESIEEYWQTGLGAGGGLRPSRKLLFFDHAVEVAPPAQGQPLIAYPLPAADRLYVRADLRGPLHLRVYDLQGRLLLTQDNDADRLQASGIDVSQVPTGLYLLQIEAARTRHTVRIQVQH